MKIMPYLDNWLVSAPSRFQVAQDTAALLSHVAWLGLRVMSFFVPSQNITFLGVAPFHFEK